MKYPTHSQATDALTGDEEQNEKQKRKKEKNRERVPNPTTLDHSVASYDTQGSYGHPILLTPPHPGLKGGIAHI